MAINKRIVFNRRDGGVSICTPTDWALTWMSCGGFWDDKPRGFMDIQIERQIARSVPKDAARRYARAIQFGGCTTAEALEILRDRDCFNGFCHELWDASEIPNDWWFRDAWRRSHNGGPISVDLEKARPLQLRHIVNAVTEEKKRRSTDLSIRGSFEPDMDALKDKIKMAADETELRNIWF
jgi:hypothetical protein